MGAGRVKVVGNANGWDEQKIQQVIAEGVQSYDQLSGANSPDLKTFQV